MIVFSGTKSTALAWEVSKQLKCPAGKTDIRKFPDGEIYVRVETEVAGKECAVIQSTRSSDDFMEIIFLMDALRDAGATQIHLMAPYLGYMRQDKVFKEGEALSAKTILKTLHELADSISTINCHFLNSGGETVFNSVNFMNLDAIPTIVDYMRKDLKNPVVIAPDKGSLTYAKAASEMLGCQFNHLEKTRISGEEVSVEDKKLNVNKKDVLMIDDIISTGGTIIEASKIIRKYRPASINVACVHGLFLSGVKQFQGVVDRIVSTNTIESPISKISVARIIADDLRR
ncbi:MAG: ribose-phosphate diphosphokinase [Candidatus Altiarchaeota archaeon]